MREIDHYHCGDCKYFKVDADWSESTCKRIDHKTIQFGKPWFKSYDCNQHSGVICSDFIPAEWNTNAIKNWKGFEEYWGNYVDQWLPYRNTDILIPFIINGDTSCRYMVKLMDFMNGTMMDGDKLKAVEKMYYKRDRNPKGFGYKLIREPVNGVLITDKN